MKTVEQNTIKAFLLEKETTELKKRIEEYKVSSEEKGRIEYYEKQLAYMESTGTVLVQGKWTISGDKTLLDVQFSRVELKKGKRGTEYYLFEPVAKTTNILYFPYAQNRPFITLENEQFWKN